MKTLALLAHSTAALLLCVAPLPAQQRPQRPEELLLKGKVLLSSNSQRPSERPAGGVKIKVKNRTVGNRDVEGPQDLTIDESWYHRAPLNANVDVYFSRKGYVLETREVPVVTEEHLEMDTVTLQCECPPLPPPRPPRHSSTRRTEAGGGGTASAREGVVAGIYGGEYEAENNGPASSQASPARLRAPPKADDLRKHFEQQAEIALRGDLLDIFLYNFSASREAYKEVRELQKVFDEFSTNHPEIFKPIGRVTPAHFDSVIRGELGTEGPEDLASLKEVITEDSIDADIRGSASVAQLDFAPDDAEMRTYYAGQLRNPVSPFYATAVVAVLRVGSEADKNKVYTALYDPRTRAQRPTLFGALRAAAIIEGVDGLGGAAQALARLGNSDPDPLSRAGAAFAFRPFAYNNNQTAIDTLLKMAQKPDETPEVRAQAILALGVGDVEKDKKVEDVLKELAKGGNHYLVRFAANMALSGKRNGVYAFRFLDRLGGNKYRL